MPLTPYKRGKTWWARGTVEFNGRTVTRYIRESTSSSTEAGAREWIADRQAREERQHVLGEEADEREFTFGDAIMLYDAKPDMAKHLIPIAKRLLDTPVRKITALQVRNLARALYPNNSTDSWKRWVVTPVRAVINNAHDLGKCPPIRIADYQKKERIDQDKRRGKKSRVPKTPGSWDWLLVFRQHARPYHAALAHFMFATGARVGQAVAMKPGAIDFDAGTVTVPGAKGHEDRVVRLSPELIEELRALPPKAPRGYDRRDLRVFGFATRFSPLKGWRTACQAAGVDYLPPHSSGRHGFGQEMHVRQGVDTKAVESVGGWSPQGAMVARNYTHPEQSDQKILDALRTGRVQAENRTGLKLSDSVGKKA